MPRLRVQRLLQGYYWDRRNHNYIRAATGRFVARGRIVELLEKSVAARERRLFEGVRRLVDGTRSPQVFLSHAKIMLKRQYLQNAALAAGGWDRLTPADFGGVGGKLQAQYRRLSELTQGIRDGEVSEAQALNRMQMYMGNARAEYFEVERERLPAVPQGQTRIEQRRLGAKDKGNCFPAGTRILTASGEKPIESVRIGEYVWTRYGLRTVTKTFARPYTGGLVCIKAKGRTVQCTPNHPFAVGQKEWVTAKMLGSQEPMLFEDCAYSLKSHVTFPNTLDSKSSNGKVLVSGHIPFSLRGLPRTQRLETWMAMPPVTIGLDDELIADQGIDNELGFDQMMGFIGNAQAIEIGEQTQFQLGRLIALQTAVALEECSGYVWPLAPQGKSLLSQSFTGSRSMTRIMFTHSLGGIATEPLMVNPLFAQSDLEPLYSALHHLNGQAKGLCDRFRSFHRIPFMDESIKFIGGSRGAWPSFRMERRYGSMFSTKGLFTIVLIPAYRASSQTRSGSIKDFGFVIEAQVTLPISSMTTDRTSLLVAFQRPPGIRAGTTASSRSIISCLKGLPTMNTDFTDGFLSPPITHELPPLLHRHNDHTRPLYDFRVEVSNEKRMVYNLEVEQVHEYVAEGFVVHNCDDCLRWAGMGWQAEGILPVPAQASQCDGNCRCTMHRIIVDAERATAAMGTKGRP